MAAIGRASPGDVKKRFGVRVRELRERAGLSQGDFARTSGVSKVFIGVVELGKKVASIETVVRLANGLGVSPVELFRFDASSAPEDAASTLGRKVTGFARGAGAEKIDRFERMARVYFEKEGAREKAPRTRSPGRLRRAASRSRRARAR